MNGDNANITEDNGTLRIEVLADAPNLSIADLAADPIEVVSSEGITCPEDPEGSSDPVTLTGTLATTPSGDVALRTKNDKGDREVLPLVTEKPSQQERLEELAASKFGRVEVTGLEVTKKEAKAKEAKAKVKKAKSKELKKALKVTSVKRATNR